MRRLVCVFFALLFLAGISGAAAGKGNPAEETGLEKFRVRHGCRDSRKIAITMDDANEREWVWKTVELCRRYGITMTFFPNGFNLHEEDREGWLDVIDAGCEIGSHGNDHASMEKQAPRLVLYKLGLFQEKLDAVLQIHYPVRWFRPPFGKTGNGAAIKTTQNYGFDHALLWDVSETDAKKAIHKVQNGSILLYHARKKDYECLEALIPMLLEDGFEPVTVSELFGFPMPEPGGELYVFDRSFSSKN